ncbi:hypothetical protein [Acinetobacter sp.]|uniref:hypothetical protein n=1 Tax=Acinetobacter sp. TaxID=472 RepID=UPI00388F8A4C
MNAAVQQQHILQTVDWSRFNLEEWLYQFGAWMNSVSGTCGRSVNPIAVAMDQAVVKCKQQKKLTDAENSQVIANYFTSEDKPKRNRSSIICQIDDNEARAVQKLILDIQGQSEILDDWMDAVIDRYFYGNSWSQMVTEERSQNDARSDVKCGLAALHCRYGFISF